MLLDWYGVEVPLFYVAKSMEVATSYPNACNTGKVTVAESTYKHGLPGGAILATDGSPPMRAVLRCVADQSKHLFHKGSNQSGFFPQDLHVTHIMLYSTSAQLANEAHVQSATVCSDGSHLCMSIRGGGFAEAEKPFTGRVRPDPNNSRLGEAVTPIPARRPVRQLPEEPAQDMHVAILGLVSDPMFKPLCPQAYDLVKSGKALRTSKARGNKDSKQIHVANTGKRR